MRLIEEYEALRPLEGNPKKLDLRYSELLPDLEYIQKQLENAQVNLETLAIYADREQPANLHIIHDVNDEKIKRTRAIQLNTAKRVVKRFFINKEHNEDKSTMTDPDEISMLKNFFNGQLDAMMEREIVLMTEIKSVNHKNSLQKDRIDLLDKNVDDLKTIIHARDEYIEELQVHQKVFFGQLQEKDREMRSVEKLTNDLKSQVAERERISVVRIKEIQEWKVKLFKLQEKFAKLDTEKQQVDYALAKLQSESGDMPGRIDELEQQLQAEEKKAQEF